MKERIFSLETEYAISFQPADGSELPDKKKIFEAINTPLIEKYGIPGCAFLINGSKFYLDQGHAEWCLPECRSAKEAVVYDKTADFILGSLLSEAENYLTTEGYQGRLLIVKNNTDTEGNTYGCHENYMAERETRWLGIEDHLRLTARYLIPFLVTRQVFCGAGRVGFGYKLDEGFGFQLMQRADFMDAIVSNRTTDERAIFNISRESEPLASGNYRRLHLILADSNMSGWATWLKLGITGILLRMIEDMMFDDIPHLQDPVYTLRQISRDTSLRERLDLRDGRELNALEIQRIYMAQAKNYFEYHEMSSEEQELIRVWEETLNQLEQDSTILFGKIDWITKKCVMEGYLQKTGLTWNDDLKGQPAYYNLLRMDIQYHDLNKQNGLFCKLLRGKSDTLVSDDEIANACISPPPYTRAKIRSDVIDSARKSGTNVEVNQWDSLIMNRQNISIGNPLDFFALEVFGALNGKMK